METTTIQGETRPMEGRHANDRLRKRGMLPAVIYGHGQAPETVALSLHDTELALDHMKHVIQLQIDGKGEQYLIKDVQYDHLQSTPIHVDLMRVDADERVQVKVALELVGTPEGVHHGGSVTHIITSLDVECPVSKIPEVIRVHIDHLELNQALHAKDVTLPEDVTSLHEPDDIIAVVQPPKGTAEEEVEAEAPEEGSAEPEIIGKGKQESEDEGGD